MKIKKIGVVLAATVALGLGIFGKNCEAANPYLPMWEHIPDGEPYIFEDPDEPGSYRVYIYGSHDTRITEFCGYDLVAWSAPLDDLNNWRYDGVIFESIVNDKADVLFAPDVALKVDEDGNKTYYLYPNNQSGGRNGMVASSDSPIGPFEVCNWKNAAETQTDGVLGFDPAVFVDDDGRVYGYWGFQSSNMAELDPDTMATVKEGCSILTEKDTGIDNCNDPDGPFRFFEASSIRKIKMNGQSKYVFVYSRTTLPNEDGLGASNSTLAYAYSDGPLGPWTYGGTVVDARAREINENGKPFESFSSGNTHGSIIEINGQWYVFYHRCINNDMYSRQATVEPITVNITDEGAVEISKAEVTSQGFEINGLNPYKKVSAGIMCYRIGSSYVKATYDENVDCSPVVSNKKGNIIGYKYYNFDLPGWQHLTGFDLDIIGKGLNGKIKLMIDSPWTSKGGTEIGTVDISADDSTTEITTKHVDLSAYDDLSGKHALYMVFDGPSGKEIADIYYLSFTGDGIEPSPTPVPTPTPVPATQAPTVTQAPLVTPSQTPAAQTTQKPLAAAKKGTKITYKGIKYLVTSSANGKASVSAAGVVKKSIRSFRIPATVKYKGVSYKVTAVKAGAFKKCTRLTSVVIGKNVKTIGSKAFADCKALKKVLALNKKVKVGNKAFAGVAKKVVAKLPK